MYLQKKRTLQSAANYLQKKVTVKQASMTEMRGEETRSIRGKRGLLYSITAISRKMIHFCSILQSWGRSYNHAKPQKQNYSNSK